MNIRKPAVAGMFYPGDEQGLKNMITGLMAQCPEPASVGKIAGLVLPHAGYVYSGAIAAQGYAYVKDMDIDTVVVIAPSHRAAFSGVSVNPHSYLTPLGTVPVDKDMVNALQKASSFTSYMPQAHEKEHAVEVQLPFIQTIFPHAHIVPVVMGSQDIQIAQDLAQAIARSQGNKKILLIASSDFSHYHEYSKANKMDALAVDYISSLDSEGLYQAIRHQECELCGFGPVMTLMAYARQQGAHAVNVLKYANSGDTAGNKKEVVGYAAIAFSASAGENDKKAQQILHNTSHENVIGLSNEQKEILLRIARQTALAYLSKEPLPDMTIADEKLNQQVGAFVTLWNNGQLRGCVGRFHVQEPLWQVIQEMAVASTTDGRFRSHPVTASELDDINIEISVLSPFERANSIDDIVLGKHGIYIRKGLRSGTFLPEVAHKTGWSREEFVQHCLKDKAGLPADALEHGAELYLYTAEVFSEDEMTRK